MNWEIVIFSSRPHVKNFGTRFEQVPKCHKEQCIGRTKGALIGLTNLPHARKIGRQLVAMHGSGHATIARGEYAVTGHDEFHRQLLGYGLSTAEINYYLPDFPSVLQVFVWQHYDEAPHFPLLNRFLEHWRHEIEAVVHSVRLAHSMLLGPRVWHPVGGIITIQ